MQLISSCLVESSGISLLWVKLKCFCCIQRFWTEKTNVVIIRFKSSSVMFCVSMVVSLKWVWRKSHYNITFFACNIALFLQCTGLRCNFSSLLGLFTKHLGDTAPVSEESVCGVCCAIWQSCSAGTAPQSLIHTTCSAMLVQNWHRVINVVLLMSSGKTGRGWCCRKTESVPGFAAVIQSESVSLLVFAVFI